MYSRDDDCKFDGKKKFFFSLFSQAKAFFVFFYYFIQSQFSVFHLYRGNAKFDIVMTRSLFIVCTSKVCKSKRCASHLTKRIVKTRDRNEYFGFFFKFLLFFCLTVNPFHVLLLETFLIFCKYFLFFLFTSYLDPIDRNTRLTCRSIR